MLNVRDEVGNTALREAIRKNNAEDLQNLIDLGSNVNVKDEEGHTALMHAAWGGSEEVIPILADNAKSMFNISTVTEIVSKCYGHLRFYYFAPASCGMPYQEQEYSMTRENKRSIDNMLQCISCIIESFPVCNQDVIGCIEALKDGIQKPKKSYMSDKQLSGYNDRIYRRLFNDLFTQYLKNSNNTIFEKYALRKELKRMSLEPNL